ncbi:MAG TPA: hypothetical protein VE575_02640 [Acidimicrobiales bacterium]|jgi:hypothetical protein|nr:hypothetical protein [Acidimicrobiales bacterium]
MDGLATRRLQAARARVGAHAPVLTLIAVAAIWAGLALNQPSTTFHLAPAAMAAAWPFMARARHGRASLAAATSIALGAFALTATLAIVLRALDALRGPALVGGSALGESLIAAFVGALWGFWVLGRECPGVVLSLLGITDDKDG